MKFSKVILTTVLATTLAACSSTPKQKTMLPVTVSSTDEYQWEEDKSFAMNIAQMVKPAGVGYGLEDTDNPQAAVVEKKSTALNVIGGFMVGGLLSAAEAGFNTGRQNDKRSWNPTIVNFIPASLINDLNAPETRAFLKNFLGKKLKLASENFGSELKWQDNLTHYQFQKTNGNFNIFSGSECTGAINFAADEGITVPPFSANWDDNFIENYDSNILNDYCYLNTFLNISGSININGKKHYVLVAEIGASGSSVYILNKLLPFLDSFVLVPDVASFHRMQDDRKHLYFYGAPKLVENGNFHYFDKNEKSELPEPAL